LFRFIYRSLDDELSKRIASNPDLVKQIGGIYQFEVTKDGKTQTWFVDLKNGKGSVGEGKNEKAECTLTTNDDDFVGMMTGKANSQQLFMQGKLKIKGNMGLAMKLDKLPKKKTDEAPAKSTATPAASSSSSGFKAAAVFDQLAKTVASNSDLVKQVGGVYQFDITSNGKTNTWFVDLKNGKGSVGEGKPEKADCTLSTGDDEFVGMMTGKLNSQQLFMQGKLKIKGNMGLAMKLNKLSAPKAAL